MQYYKDKGKIFFQVGLVTSLSLVILFFSYGWITRSFANNKYEKIQVSFVSGGGLAKGATVCVKGVPSGFVNHVEVTNAGVLFELKVELPFSLSEGTVFVVEDTDLMGNKQLNILPSLHGKELNLDEVQQGEVKITFNRFIIKMNDILQELESGGLDFQRVGQILGQLEQVVLGTKVALNTLNKDEGLLAKSQEILDETGSLLKKINDENTSTGKFLSDSILYEQIVTSTKRVDSLLIDVRANPTKYFKIEVF